MPVILPTGYTLTVYGTNGFVRRVGNHRTGLSSVDLCGQGLRKGGVLSSDDQSSTDKKGAAVMGKAIMSAFLAGFLLVSGGVAPGRAQAFDQVVNAPAATGMAAAAYTVFPQDRLRHPIEPYLSSGHPDSVTPGLSYQATCWKHGQYVTSVTGQGGSDIWVRLYGNHGHLGYGPVVHFLAWPGSVTAGVATKCS